MGRGSSKYFRGDPTTPGYPSYYGTYADSVQDLLTFTKENSYGPHIFAPLPQQPITIYDAQYLLNILNDGPPIPESWRNESGLTLQTIGGDLAKGLASQN